MAKRVLNIEFGAWWTKVAVTDGNKKAPQVFNAFYFETPEHAIEDGYIRDKEALAERLLSELVQRQIMDRTVIFSINSSKIISREVTIPLVKDSQIQNVITSQAKDFFPMDISNYRINYLKMGGISLADSKEMKLLLVATPDNLMNNYMTFAEATGLSVLSFEYIGLGPEALMMSHFAENALCVQIEEQMTIVSIISDRKLAFQRVTPYGYMNAVNAVLGNEVFGAGNEREAFEFLAQHDLLGKNPHLRDYKDKVSIEYEDDEELMAILNDAYLDVREAIGYHARLAATALDFYKSQTKQTFYGRLYIIGDATRFAGIKELFQSEIPVQRMEIDAPVVAHWIKGGPQAIADVPAEGILSVLGANAQILQIRPKDLQEEEEKKVNLKTAYYVLFGCVGLSVLLLLVGAFQAIFAAVQHKYLTSEIERLAYIQEIYDENAQAKAQASAFENFDNMTKADNERMAELMTGLEQQLPTTASVQSLSVTGSSISMNITTDTKMTAAKLLMNLKEIEFLDEINIPSIAEGEDESGNKYWQFTVSAQYVNPPAQTVVEVTPAEDTEAADDSAEADN